MAAKLFIFDVDGVLLDLWATMKGVYEEFTSQKLSQKASGMPLLPIISAIRFPIGSSANILTIRTLWVHSRRLTACRNWSES